MAYPSDWKGGEWREVGATSGYRIRVLWSYKQDPIANKTLIACQAMRIEATGGTYSMHNIDNNMGLHVYNRSNGSDPGERTASVNVGSASGYSNEWIWDFNDVWSEFSMQSNGVAKDPNDTRVPEGQLKPADWKWIADPSNSLNATYYQFPKFNWTEFSVPIPNIDRNPPDVTLTYQSKTKSSISFNYTSRMDINIIQYRLNGGSWNVIHNSGNTKEKSYTITGLKPGTQYKVEVQSRRTYNEVWSEIKNFTQTTDAPSAPTAGTVTASDITINSAKLNWSGFTVDSASGVKKYQVTTNNGSSYTDVGNVTSYVLTGLTPGTTYNQVGVRVVDNNNQTSSLAKVTFTTLVDQAKIRINVSGTTKVGKVFVKVNGTTTKAKKIYVNVNGTAKLYKSA